MMAWLREYWHWVVFGVFVAGYGVILYHAQFSNQDSGFRIKDYGDPENVQAEKDDTP